MLSMRREAEIYHENGGWFQSRFHFSFDRYRDADHMGFGALRVFNDDRIVPGAEWPMHPHRDIESLTYVVAGHFLHADSLGHGGTLEPGAVQVMTFGHEGAQHSERNGSQTEPMRFIQFWILPSEEGLASGVQQKQYDAQDRAGRWLQVMGPRGEDGLDLAQDARVLVARLDGGARLEHEFGEGRGCYAYLIDGAGKIDGTDVLAGDAAQVDGPHKISLEATATCEWILVDVPLRFTPVGVWAGRV